jgi:hypothetical protein
LHEWTARPRSPQLLGTVYFGDSLVIGAGYSAVPRLLEERLAERGIEIALGWVVHLAFRPINFYELAGQVLAGGPRIAVVEVNVRLLSAYAAARPPYRFVTLSRFLSPRRQWRAREALAADEIGVLDPALYRLEERLDVLHVADGVRIRADDALVATGNAVTRVLGLRTRDIGWWVARMREILEHLDAAEARAAYAVDQGSHPLTAALRGLGRELRAAGVLTLFYGAPVDVDRLAALGVREEIGLAARVEALRQAVGAPREEWLDLHDLLPGAAFMDTQNHLQREGVERVAAAIADALVARLRTENR